MTEADQFRKRLLNLTILAKEFSQGKKQALFGSKDMQEKDYQDVYKKIMHEIEALFKIWGHPNTPAKDVKEYEIFMGRLPSIRDYLKNKSNDIQALKNAMGKLLSEIPKR
ncbi:MAG: hypothetical protein ACOC32_02545 [Nanoarchaeota archaeon]